MDEDSRRILELLAAGQLPESIPDSSPYAAELRRLVEYSSQIQQFVLALSQGDLSQTLNASGGSLTGSLKALQSSLRHITWQTQMIAEGHFDQRVDFMGEFSAAFNTMVDWLQSSYDNLRFLGTHDLMTGLYNRAFFDAEFERIGKGRRFPVSLIVADADGLKKVNDSLGHAAGDRLLKKIAGVLAAAFRADDIIARTGGDEFGIILPEVDEETTGKAIIRIRASEAASNPQTDDLRVSLSLGSATALGGADLPGALKAADDRMYTDKIARRVGRN